MSLKTWKKMAVYTNKCVCPGNIWRVVIIRVNTRANIIWQSDFGKIHWQILFNKFLCSVWMQILCFSFFDKYSLSMKNFSWELSFKHASKTLLKIKPRNKDDWTMNTLTKMIINTDKCICSDNIWCVPVIRVNTLENIICQSDFGRLIGKFYLTKSLICVNTHTLLNIIRQIFSAKETLSMGT